MTTDTLAFELVSPERILISRQVTMVIMPGSEGYFGAQPGHAPFIASLRPGVIDVYEGQAVADRIFVAGGFAEIEGERCTVLAEQAIAVSSFDRTEIERRITALTEAIRDAKTDTDRRHVQSQLSVAQAQLEAATGQVVVS